MSRGTKRASATPAQTAPRTLRELMMQALAMETEAAERYAELADAMEMHNNRAVAVLFRKLAEIEQKHVGEIMQAMGWTSPPPVPPGLPRWDGFEAPETTPTDEVHYLMQPYHALELALGNEQRAEAFFGRLARTAKVPSVAKAARALEAEEREHVALVRAWLEKTRKPERNWADDPDPARYTD